MDLVLNFPRSGYRTRNRDKDIVTTLLTSIKNKLVVWLQWQYSDFKLSQKQPGFIITRVQLSLSQVSTPERSQGVPLGNSEVSSES